MNGLKRPKIGNDAAAIIKAINQMSDNIGKWLGIIALAVANPADNSTEVQAHIDQAAKQLKQQTDELEAAVIAQKG